MAGDVKEASTPSDTPPPKSGDGNISPAGMQAMQGLDTSVHDSDWNTGRPAELAALEKIKQEHGSSIDLNSPAAGGHKNYKIYDAAGPETVASVKHYGQGESGELSETTLANYRHAFAETIGRGNDPAVFQAAARDLSRLAAEGKPVPPELKDNPTEYLKRRAEMLAPADHAHQIQADLRRRFHAEDGITRQVTAENYGLNTDSDTYTQDVADLLERIKPLPKTSAELNDEFVQRSRSSL